MSDVTYKDVWNTLSKIDCSDHVEKKMNLSYLSWAWAWGILMEHYAESQVRFYENKETGVPYVQFPDGTAEVRCRVSVCSCTFLLVATGRAWGVSGRVRT